MPIARRLSTMSPYIFQRLGEKMEARKASGHPVIDLGISDPDLPPSAAVVTALQQAVDGKGAHRYPPYDGTQALRQAVARYYARQFGVSVDPDRQVLVTLGSKEALVHLLFALVNPDDVVLAPDPGYPAYFMGGPLLGARTVALPLTRRHHFLPVLSDVPTADQRKARLLYVNYPNNPTGKVASLAEFKEWVAFCREHDTVLVSDLAYADIVYEGRAHSALEIPGAQDLVVESITWSKGHSMQGWRVGALVGAPDLLAAISCVESNINAGVFLPIQAAAAVALEEDHPAILCRQYRDRRDYAYRKLVEMGLGLARPEGAVYCWVEAPGGDGDRFAEAALEKGVAVTPGSAFGPQSQDHVRISLTHPIEVLQEGFGRLAQAVPETVLR